MARKIQDLFFALRARTEGLEADLNQAERHLGKFSSFVLNNPVAAAGGLGAALLTVAMKAEVMASQVERSMIRMQQAMPATTANLAEIRKGIEAISRSTPHAQDELAQMAAEIAKLGVNDPAEILQRLKVAVDIADASGADLKVTLGALDTVADQFRLTTTEAGHALTIMFATTQGRIPLEELFTTIERGGSVLASFGITATEAADALVAIQDAGVPGRQAGSALLSIFTTIENASKGSATATETQKAAMRGLADALNPSTIATRGFSAAVEGLLDRVGRSRDALEQMGFAAKDVNALFRIAEGTARDNRTESEKLAEAQRKVADAYTLNRESADSLNKIIHNNLDATLIQLGNRTLPIVNANLQAFLSLIDRSYARAAQLDEAFQVIARGPAANGSVSVEQQTQLTAVERRLRQAGGANIFEGLPLEQLEKMYATADALFKVTGEHRDVVLALGAAYDAAEQKVSALDDAERLRRKKAAEDAAAEERKRQQRLAAEEADRLKSRRESARGAFESAIAGLTPGKEDDFSTRMKTLIDQAKQAKLQSSEITALVERLRAARSAVREGEATEAMRSLDDAMSALAEGPLKQLDGEFAAVMKNTEKWREQVANAGGDLTKFDSHLTDLVNGYRDLRSAVEAVTKAQKDAKAIEAELFKNKQDPGAQLKAVDDYAAAIDRLKERQGGLSEDSREYQTLQTEIATLEQRRTDIMVGAVGATANLSNATGKLAAEIEAQRAATLKNIESWATYARALVSVAQAAGKLDSVLVATLDNAIGLAEGIAKIRAGKGAEGGIEAISSLGGLISSITELGHRASQTAQRSRELSTAIARMFQSLEDEITGGASLADRRARIRQQYEDARNQVERDLGGTKHEAERERALAKLDVMERNRLELLEREFAEEQHRAQADYEVRRLRALGLDEEAEALAFAEAQQREFAEAVRNGADATTLAALAAAQSAEAHKHAADVFYAAFQKSLSDIDTALQINDTTDPIARLAARADAYKAIGGDLAHLFDGLDLTKAEDVATLDERVRELFAKLKESPESVDLAGLSIDQLIAALLDLDSAADAVAQGIETAAQKMQAALDQLSLEEAIFGTTPTEHAKNLAGVYGFDLSQFDLSTAGGRDAAIAFLQDLFKQHPENSAVGQQIANVIQALRAIQFAESSVGGAGASTGRTAGAGGAREAIGNAAQSLTEVTGNRMADYLAALLVVNREELQAMDRLADTLTAPIITGPIVPPMLPAWFSGGGLSAPQPTSSGASGGTQIFRNTFIINVNAAVEDADQVARDIARQAAKEFNRLLAEQYTAARKSEGETLILGV